MLKPTTYLAFLLIPVFASCLDAAFGYALVYEENGVEHSIAGVEDFKPYYESNGERHFLTLAGRVDLRREAAYDPTWAYYPVNYCIEHIGKKHPDIPERFTYRAYLRIDNWSIDWKYLSIKDLLKLWPRETLAGALLVFAWIVDDKVVMFDFTAFNGSGNKDEMARMISLPLTEADLGGYPVLILFKKGKPVSPEPLAADPAMSSLFFAAQTNDIELLRKALDNDSVDVRSKDKFGYTALHYAASSGHNEIVDVLLKHDSPIDKRGGKGQSALIFAASNSRQKALESLVEGGARVNAKDHGGYTALHYAVRYGHPKSVKVLLRNEADANQLSEYSYSPMMLTLNYRRGEIVQILDRAGAKLKLWNRELNWSLVNMAEEGDPEIIKYFLSKNADPNVTIRDTLTPLLAAARAGDVAALELLVQAGAEIDLADKDGRTPLMAASQSGNTDAVKYLVDAGAGVDRITRKGFTPLHYAAARYENDVVRLLIEAGANPNIANESGYTPLEVATIGGSREIVDELLRAGAQCDLGAMERGRSFMECAFRYNIPEVARIVLQQCLPADFKFYDRFPVLWVAEYYENDEIADMLKSKGAKPDFNNLPVIVPEDMLDRSPEVVKRVGFDYSYDLQRRYGTNEVEVSFLVDEEGRVKFPKIVSGKVPGLNNLVVNTVLKWEFSPGLVGGKPVLTQARQQFILEKRELGDIVLEFKDVEPPRPVHSVRFSPMYFPYSNISERLGLNWDKYQYRLDEKGRIMVLFK